MATKGGTWHTWAGSRNDLSRAVREATDALLGWSGYPAAVTATVTYANGLSETLVGADALDEIYGSDLPGIRSLWIEVQPDQGAYYAERNRLQEEYDAERAHQRDLWEQVAKERVERGEDPGWPQEPPAPEEPEPLISAAVLLRVPFGGRGLLIEVKGPDRHQVMGLFERVAEILTRRQAFRRLDPDIFLYGLAMPLALAGLIAGPLLARAFGLAHVNGKWDPAEIVGLVAGPALAVAICVGFWWLHPAFEILDANEKTRAERFAKVFWGMVGGVTVSLIAAGIWAGLSS